MLHRRHECARGFYGFPSGFPRPRPPPPPTTGGGGWSGTVCCLYMYHWWFRKIRIDSMSSGIFSRRLEPTSRQPTLTSCMYCIPFHTSPSIPFHTSPSAVVPPHSPLLPRPPVSGETPQRAVGSPVLSTLSHKPLYMYVCGNGPDAGKCVAAVWLLCIVKKEHAVFRSAWITQLQLWHLGG